MFGCAVFVYLIYGHQTRDDKEGHVAYEDENRSAYCIVMRKPEGKLSIHVGVILKWILKK